MTILGIAMCTYNGEKYIEEQLASILSQTRQPDKMIICDDMSSDNTVNILKKFAYHAPFDVEIVVNKENLGSTKNFEKAIQLCDTDIIVLSDQDDVWLPGKLQKTQVAFEINPDCGYVFTDAQLVDEKLQSLGCTMWETIGFTENKRTLFNQGYDKKIIIKGSVVTGATMAFRGNTKKLILPIPGFCVHDEWISSILTLKGKKGVFIDEPLILYRQHSEQQIGATNTTRNRTATAKRISNSIYSIESMEEEIRKAGWEQELADIFVYQYIRSLTRELKYWYSNPEHHNSIEGFKEAETFLKDRFLKISLNSIFFNRHLTFGYKLKAVRAKLGIYKWEKAITKFFK